MQSLLTHVMSMYESDPAGIALCLKSRQILLATFMSTNDQAPSSIVNTFIILTVKSWTDYTIDQLYCLMKIHLVWYKRRIGTRTWWSGTATKCTDELQPGRWTIAAWCFWHRSANGRFWWDYSHWLQSSTSLACTVGLELYSSPLLPLQLFVILITWLLLRDSHTARVGRKC